MKPPWSCNWKLFSQPLPYSIFLNISLFQLECKTSGVGKFGREFSLADDGEGSTANTSSSEMFNEPINVESIKQEQIPTNPFLVNEVSFDWFLWF